MVSMVTDSSGPIWFRPEQPVDHDAIHALHAAAFPTDSEARLVDELRASGHLSVSLVATEADSVVGHVAFSPVTLAGADSGLGLGPVAVVESRRRRGIGAQLIRSGLEACSVQACGFVVVLGEPGYYRRFGFSPAGSRRLFSDFGGGDAFQVIELRPNMIPTKGGRVRYVPEFALVSGADRDDDERG